MTLLADVWRRLKQRVRPSQRVADRSAWPRDGRGNLHNPKRDARRAHGLLSGRQWVRLRRRLRHEAGA